MAWMAYKEQRFAAYAAAANGAASPGDVDGLLGDAQAGAAEFGDAPIAPGRELVVDNLSVAKGESLIQRVSWTRFDAARDTLQTGDLR